MNRRKMCNKLYRYIFLDDKINPYKHNIYGVLEIVLTKLNLPYTYINIFFIRIHNINMFVNILFIFT